MLVASRDAVSVEVPPSYFFFLVAFFFAGLFFLAAFFVAFFFVAFFFAIAVLLVPQGKNKI